MNTFPYDVKPLDAKLNEKVNPLILGGSDSVQIEPKKYIFPCNYGNIAETIYNFEIRPNDVWIVTYPRSGTTVTQEIIWLTINDDYEAAINISLNERFRFLESTMILSDDIVNTMKSQLVDDKERLSLFLKAIRPQWEVLQNIPGRRFIKTHIPLSLLPPNLLTSGAKVIYVARNPKDVAISRYHQERSLAEYEEDFETYWDIFQNDLVMYSPYWEHLEEAWSQKDNKNLLFLFYEDIVKSYKDIIIEVSKFLETPLSDEQISKMEKFLEIDTFRKVQHRTDNLENFFTPPGVYEHVRKGKSGEWDDYFRDELNKKANKWIKENFDKTTLRFPIDLL